jgi:integrase
MPTEKPRRWGRNREVTLIEVEEAEEGKKGRKTRYFTNDESDAILEVAKERSDEVYITMLAGYSTGCRISELRSMTAADLIPERGGIYVMDSKKKTRRFVPLLDVEVKALQDYIKKGREAGLLTRDDQPLFPMSKKTYNRWLKQLALDVGVVWDGELENVRWHSWRGTFVRRMHEAGRASNWLEKVVGDKFGTLLQYYSELTEDDLVRIHRKDEVVE